MPVDRSSAVPTPIFPEEFKVSKRRKSKSRGFKDVPYWDNLASRYLNSHKLPNWGTVATVESSIEWMRRTGISESRFYNVLGLDVVEFLRLNKKWPLRAVIGLLLEIKETGTNKTPIVG